MNNDLTEDMEMSLGREVIADAVKQIEQVEDLELGNAIDELLSYDPVMIVTKDQMEVLMEQGDFKDFKRTTPIKLHIDGTFLSEDDYGRYARGLVTGLLKEYESLNIELSLRIIGYSDKQLNINELPEMIRKFVVPKIPLDVEYTFAIGEPTVRDIYLHTPAVGKTFHLVLFHTSAAPPFWQYQLGGVDELILPQQFPFGYDPEMFDTKDSISKLRKKYKFIAYINSGWTKLGCAMQNIVFSALAMGKDSLIIYRTAVNEQDLKLIKRNIQQQLMLYNTEGRDLPKIIISNKNVTEKSHAIYYRLADVVIDVNKSSLNEGKHLDVYACGTPLITSHNHPTFANNQDEILCHVWHHDFENANGTGFYDIKLGLLWKKFVWKNLTDMVAESYKLGREELAKRGARLKHDYVQDDWGKTAKSFINFLREYSINEDKPKIL